MQCKKQYTDYDLSNQQKWNHSDTKEVPTEKQFKYPQQKKEISAA